MTPLRPDTVTTTSASGTVLLGSSEPIARLRRDIASAARSDSKVLITGETGVGKEVVARLIHEHSARRRFAFVAVNSAGLTDDLLESELFGHVRGSFTGAYRDRMGLAVQADRGTLFLDELGEMSPRMQGVLLRFLETGEIHPVGSERAELHADARVLAATNRNLAELVAAGRFREDLYYRLNVIQLAIPPLRDRGSDILELFAYYLAHYCRALHLPPPALLPETEVVLLNYRWPGNVRELRNIAERLALREFEKAVTPNDLPQELRNQPVTLTRPSLLASSSPAPAAPSPLAGRWMAADAAWDEMMRGHRSFWAVVHPRFINRELTKADVREIIRRGLEQTQGSYRKVVELFHMPAADYKRFLAFLTQHDCHLPFHQFRQP